MEIGLLMNALVCMAITISTAAFSYTLYRHGQEQNKKSLPSLKALIWFWSLVGIYYLLEGIRLIASYSGSMDYDAYLYQIASVPFVFIAVPLTYFIIYVLSGSQRTGLGVSFVFAMFGLTYLASMYTSGISGPEISYWGTIYSINSNLAILTYISGLFIVPTAMILGLLILILLEKVEREIKYKVAMSLLSISFVSDFILANSIVQTGEMLMASRIFVFIGSVLGFLSFFPPESFRIVLKPHFEPYKGEEDDFE